MYVKKRDMRKRRKRAIKVYNTYLFFFPLQDLVPSTLIFLPVGGDCSTTNICDIVIDSTFEIPDIRRK